MKQITLLGFFTIAFMLSFTVSSVHAESIPTPLRQVRDGVPLNEIVCYGDRALMVSPSGSPACVFAESTEALIDRGFTLEDNVEFMLVNNMMSDLPYVIDVGVMIQSTGDQAEYSRTGGDIIFVVDDFNAYLEEVGAHWSMNLVKEETFLDPIIALEKIESLNSKGIKLIIGPESSAEIHHIKPYVDANDMVLISLTATSPALAIDDNIFRMISDDTQQGKVLALLFQEQGINAVIPIYRDGIWGDGMYESTKSNFESLGGIMDDGIRYSPNTSIDFSIEVDLLSGLVDRYVAEYSTEEVAVLLIGFSEAVHILNFADSYDNLHEVRWFGSVSSSNDGTLSDDLISAAFIEDVNFVSTQYTTSTNEIYIHVRDHLVDTYHDQTPDVYGYYFYDSIFVLGKTILATDSVDPLVISDALPGVAATHIGAMGMVKLNEFGDLAAYDYELWTIRDGEWVEYGRFNAESGTFDYYVMDSGGR